MDIITQLTGFVFTGISFWIATIALLGLLVASYFNTNGFLFFVTIGLSALVFTSVEWYNSFIWLIENPFMIIGSIFGYVAIGGIWSIFDWYLFVNKTETKNLILSRIKTHQESIHDKIIRNEIQKNGGTSFEDFKDQYAETKETLKKDGKLPEISLNEFLESSSNPLNIGKYKWRFISKMSYWPFSIISVLFKDFLIEIFNRIYDSLGKLYGKIAANVIQKIFEKINM